MKKLFKKLTKSTSLAVLAIIIIGAPLLYLTVLNSKPAAAWWDDNWAFRKSIAVTNNTNNQVNVYISITLDTSDTTKFQSGCQDLRFTKQNGELLPYFIVSGCQTATTIIHVNLDSFPSGAQTIFYYYGNPTAAYGYNLADFPALASNYTVGSLGSEEKSAGPIAYWQFEEATGYTAHDSSANNANASFTILSGTSNPTYNGTQGTPNTGTGADGTCSVAADTNINSASCASRGTADAINFSSTVNTAAAATSIKLTATSTGLTVGEEVLIINLQGASGNTTNVGKYETKTISSITTTTNPNDTLNFATGLTNGYDGTTQKIMVQRVPNYTNVTVNSGKTLTTTAWDGTKNGVLFFRASGTVTVTGSISMAGKGYRLGAKGAAGIVDTSGTQGESYAGTGSITTAANLGAGGGGTRGDPIDGHNAGGGGGGGGYGATGSIGLDGSDYYANMGGVGGTGGSTYGDAALAKLLLGSGGGGGGGSVNGAGGDGGSGGGIISVNATTVTVAGTINSNGNNGNPGIQGDGAGGGGGGGSGGSLQITGTNLTLGSSLLTSTAGTGGFLAPFCGQSDKNGCIYTTVSGTGGAGGIGRVAIIANSFDSQPSWQPKTQCIAGRCLYFNGTNTSASVAKVIYGVQTISFWIKPTIIASTAILDLDGGTHTITTNGSGVISANGFTSPTFYINGVVKTTPTLTVDIWQYVTITTNSSFNTSSTQTIGRVSTTYFKGYLDELKYYNFAKTADQIKSDMQKVQSNRGSSAVLGNKAKDSLLDGLVGYWKMDETASPSFDSSGNNNSGTWVGNTAATTGKYSNAVSFDGTGDYISVTKKSSLIGLTKFTVSGWIKINQAPNDFDFIVSNYVDGNSGWNVLFYTGASGGFYFGVNNTVGGGGNTAAANTLITPTLGVWKHFTYTFDGSNLGTYDDGVFKGNNPFSGTYADTSIAAMTFGVSSAFLGNDLLGSLDDVRIYNRVLSADEISALHKIDPDTEESPGPIGAWDFEEASGTTVNDTSGGGNNGTWSGTANHYTTGQYGKGGNFGGSSTIDYVDMGDVLDVDSTNRLTLEAWIKTKNVNSPRYGGIIQKWDAAAACNNGNLQSYALYMDGSTGKLLGAVNSTSNGNDNNITGTTTINDGKWHHVALTSTDDGTNNLKLFVDGKIDVQQTKGGTGIYNSATSLRIGLGDPDCGQGAANRVFNGQIDQVRIYDYARTQSQIVSDMNAGHPAVGSPIGSAVGYWDFDEGADNKCAGGVNDVCNTGSAGSVLDGAESNMSVPATATSGWTNSGKFGKALLFDGIDDFVDAGNNSALQITGSLTISAWVNFSALPGANNIIVDKDKDTPTASRGFSLAFDSTGKVYFLLSQNAAGSTITYFPTTSTLSPNTWYHVVAVYSAGSFAKIYVNGKVDATVTSSVVTSINNSTNNLGIGKRLTGTAYPFRGAIDEVKIYNYALTDVDVKTEYNRGQSLQLGAAGNNSTYQTGASNQEYCVPGDIASCASPVGRWDFEEKVSGDGKTVYDTSGSGGNGTTHNGANTTGMSCNNAGKIGNSCKLDGADDYIDMGNGTPLQITSSITIEAWVKLASVANGIYPRVVSKLTGSNYNGYELLISAPDDANPNTPYLQIGTGGALKATKNTSVPLSVNTWYHLAGVYNTTAGEGYLYLNGALVSTGTSWGASGLGSSSSNVNIGRWVGGASHYFPGQIDNVRIFNYARSAAQVALDYNKGGPVGYWDLDECQGTIANDLSGNSHTGTITIGTGAGTGQQDSAGTCTASGATAWYNGRTGKRNASLNFDGIDDYINAGTWNPAPSAVTMSAWIYPATTARDGLEHVIIAKGNDETIGSPGPSFLLNNSQGDVLCIEIVTDTLRYACTPIGAVTPNAWNHVLGVYNGSNSCSVYVNGVLKTGGIANACSGSISGALSVYIGAQNRAGTCNGHSCTYPFKGQIDDAKIFNYALTPSQIKDIYNGGAINYGPVTGSP